MHTNQQGDFLLANLMFTLRCVVCVLGHLAAMLGVCGANLEMDSFESKRRKQSTYRFSWLFLAIMRLHLSAQVRTVTKPSPGLLIKRSSNSSEAFFLQYWDIPPRFACIRPQLTVTVTGTTRCPNAQMQKREPRAP